MRQSLALVLLLLALPAVAQIYKYTDANGNTAYSNQPPDGTKAEAVNLPPLNSVDTVAPAPPPPGPAPAQNQQAAATYQVLELTDLPDGEALRANNGSFTVGVAIQPRLQPGHMLQLMIDGRPYGPPSNIPRFQVLEQDRGEHSLSVQVLQGSEIVQQSQTVNLTVQRVHVGKP
ncbi:DUF4124 domain-containing protein [Pseudomonas sp. GD03842]|uniref:DUF4124 domain-containing protein n=1 Tax=Pseudomonas sp. GD03842 TaxID=2975385 RepID=UPI002446D0B8|nr:DUF4124 domain-containing protein [Pseudomonas sp. GD03842]MDH0747236.1 DUF4124 domain-containing protein [Pseudomonas sp. GD03842]